MAREYQLPGAAFVVHRTGRQWQSGKLYVVDSTAAAAGDSPLPQRQQQIYFAPTEDYSHVWQQQRRRPLPVQVIFQDETPPPLIRRPEQGESHYPQPVFYDWWEQRRLEPIPIQVLQSQTPPPLHRNEQQSAVHWPQPDFTDTWHQFHSMRRWPIPIHTPLEIGQRLPFVPRDPKLELPLRRFVDIVSQQVNSFLRTGQIYKTGQSSWQIARSAGIISTRAPLLTDDETEGYAAGQIWIDAGSGRAYVAISVTENAAVWEQFAPVDGGMW